MYDIILPGSSKDARTFSGINTLLSSEATEQAIYDHPGFEAAVDFILIYIPDAALQDPRGSVPGKGELFPKRRIVLRALQFLAASIMRRGGGKVGDTDINEQKGAVQSEDKNTSIGPVQDTHRTTYHGPTTITRRSNSADFGDADYSNYLEQEAYKLLQLLDINAADIIPSTSEGEKPRLRVAVATTQTQPTDCPPVISTDQQIQQGTGELLPVEGELSYVEEDQ